MEKAGPEEGNLPVTGTAQLSNCCHPKKMPRQCFSNPKGKMKCFSPKGALATALTRFLQQLAKE
jgi:hypothetical protein